MGRPPTISRAAIVSAALAIIDTHGVDALTMRSIGRSLGVDAAALYHHFKNKDAVVDAVLEAALIELTVPVDPGVDLETWTVETATAYLVALRNHPNLVSLLPSRQRPFSLPVHDFATSKMKELGVPDDLLMALIDAMEGFVVGWALFTVNPRHHIERVPPKLAHLRAARRADRLEPIERFRQVARLVVRGLLSSHVAL